MRKMALSENAFKELELYAEGRSGAEISEIVGARPNSIRVKESFFKIINFGYDGIVPENIMPKYSAEELCKKVYNRMKFQEFSFRYHAGVSKEDFLSDSFVCGLGSIAGPIGLDSDIRALDLSVRTFNALIRDSHNRMQKSFTIGSLVSMSEKELFKIRQLGVVGIAEIKEELLKHGFEINQSKSSLDDLIADAAKRASPPGGADDNPLMNEKEILPEKEDEIENF